MKTLGIIFATFLLQGQLKAQTVKITILTQTDEPIEYVNFFSLDQEILEAAIDYEDSLQIEFDRETDDGYNLHYETANTTYRQQFWLDKGTQKIFVRIAQGRMEIEKVEGSEIYQNQKEFIQKLISLRSQKEEITEFLKVAFLEHSAYAFSAMIAQNYLGVHQNDPNKLLWLKENLDKQSESIKKHFIYEAVYTRLKTILADKPLDLLDYGFLNLEEDWAEIEPREGEELILDLWFIKCPPCIRDHRLIKQDFEDNQIDPEKFRFIGISIDRNFIEWKDYVKNENLTWENLLIDYTANKNLKDDLNISGFPTYLVLSSNGMIKKTFHSYKSVKEYMGSK